MAATAHPCDALPAKSNDAFDTMLNSKGNFRAKHLSFMTALSQCGLTGVKLLL